MLITKCIFNGTNQKGASRANEYSLHSISRETHSSEFMAFFFFAT